MNVNILKFNLLLSLFAIFLKTQSSLSLIIINNKTSVYSYSSDFGGTDNVFGIIKFINQQYGCNNFSINDQWINNTVNGIAVIDRGNCSFTTKVLNAQNAGYSGVIFINNINENLYPGGYDKEIVIPSALISNYDSNLLYNNDFVIIIYDKENNPNFLTMTIGILILMSIMGITYIMYLIFFGNQICRRNNRVIMYANNENIDVINNIASINEEHIECSICLSTFRSTNKSTLICGHSYHKECIIKWLKERLTCPECRTIITIHSLQNNTNNSNNNISSSVAPSDITTTDPTSSLITIPNSENDVINEANETNEANKTNINNNIIDLYIRKNRYTENDQSLS